MISYKSLAHEIYCTVLEWQIERLLDQSMALMNLRQFRVHV